jgi:AcrR family transcriptional regulator
MRSLTKRAVLLLSQHLRRYVVKKTEKIENDCSALEPMDPRVRRTRKLLQDALYSLIREKRFSAITVQDITERATVNRATFYAHYTDKEDLAASGLKADLHAALRHRFAERPTLTRENLMEFAVGVFEFMGSMHDGCPETAAELQDTLGTTVQQGLYEMMEQWLSGNPAYKRVFPGATKESVATVLSWSLYGGAYRWSRSRRTVPARQVCREIVSILLPDSNTAVAV